MITLNEFRTRSIKKDDGINLIIQYYNDKNSKRQEEYDFCLKKNLDNPAIVNIYNIIESETILSEEFKNHEKMKIFQIDNGKCGSIPGRLTFEYCFDFCKTHIPKDQIVMIANLDIFIENSYQWLHIKEEFFDQGDKNKVLCLSRLEYLSDDKIVYDTRQEQGNSSDSWCFINNLEEIKDCKFAVGNCPCCDGSIHKRFNNAGYTIYNWNEKYITYHYDICRGLLNYTLTDKTDKSGTEAGKRGKLNVKPMQNWNDILFNKKYPVLK